MSNELSQTDITPVKKQSTVDLILEGVNEIKGRLVMVERRTDSALEYSLAAHQKASMALWARGSWGPYLVSAIALGVSISAAAVTLIRAH